MLSILTPAFNEAANLDALYARLSAAMTALGTEWEWLIVDDHSSDGTFDTVTRLSAADPHVRGVRLSKNAGSHIAVTCGLRLVRGDAAVMMAADHQDPPETIAAMVAAWRQGAQIVWAVRREQPGAAAHAGFASIYYWIMRNVVGMKAMPERGADFFLIDRMAIDAFRRCDERNVSVLALITWLGFRQVTVEYDKQPRAAGASGWTLRRKIRLVIDSVTAFSSLPIRACTYVGAMLAVAALVLLVWGAATAGRLTLLAALVTGLSALNLLGLGIVGEYVWRALDEARRRPLYLLEAIAGVHQELEPPR